MVAFRHMIRVGKYEAASDVAKPLGGSAGGDPEAPVPGMHASKHGRVFGNSHQPRVPVKCVFRRSLLRTLGESSWTNLAPKIASPRRQNDVIHNAQFI